MPEPIVTPTPEKSPILTAFTLGSNPEVSNAPADAQPFTGPTILSTPAEANDTRLSVLAKPPEPVVPPAPPVEPKKEETPQPATPVAPSPAPQPQPASVDDKPKRKIRIAKGYEDLDPTRLVKETAEAVAKAVVSNQPAPAPAPTEPDLRPEEKEQISVLGHMEKLYPDRYKGIVERTKRCIAEIAKAEETYPNEWSALNPASKFETPEAREKAYREDWQKKTENLQLKHQVVWSPDDFAEAKMERRVAPVREQQGRLERENEALRAKLRAEEVAPMITGTAEGAALDVAKEIMGDSATEFVQHGQVTDERYQKLSEQNPESAPIYRQAINTAHRFALDCMSAFHDMQTNPRVVSAIGSYLQAREQQMLKLPVAQRLNEQGQAFATLKDYGKMTQAQRAAHWTFGPEDLIALHSTDVIRHAKAAIQEEKARFDRVLAKRGAAPPASATIPAPAPNPIKPVSPAAASTPSPTGVPPASQPGEMPSWKKAYLSGCGAGVMDALPAR